MFEPIHVILCAGSGSRLFPLSNENIPKQFLKLENEYSLIQNTVKRMSQFPELVITTMQKYLHILEQQLEQLELACKYTIVIVPESYNTAHSICALSLLFKGRKIIAIPCDKIFIQDEFGKLMKSANQVLDKEPDSVLFFGIKPTYPATAFGYLECENDQVVKFIEKPTLQKATEFLEEGNYYWNGGMIGFLSDTMNGIYLIHRPDIVKICNKAIKNLVISENEIVKLIKLSDTSDNVEDISIDYAINEKLCKDQMSLITFQGRWDDIGSWNSVYDVVQKNSDGINKSANYKNYNSSNCLIITNKPIYLNGVSDLIFIETDECLLLSNLNEAQDIKQFFLRKEKN